MKMCLLLNWESESRNLHLVWWYLRPRSWKRSLKLSISSTNPKTQSPFLRCILGMRPLFWTVAQSIWSSLKVYIRKLQESFSWVLMKILTIFSPRKVQKAAQLNKLYAPNSIKTWQCSKKWYIVTQLSVIIRAGIIQPSSARTVRSKVIHLECALIPRKKAWVCA